MATFNYSIRLDFVLRFPRLANGRSLNSITIRKQINTQTTQKNMQNEW